MPELEDDKGNANSEMRYITLELMKIAQRRKQPFRKVAGEFLENTYSLAELLQDVPAAHKGRGKKGSATSNREEE